MYAHQRGRAIGEVAHFEHDGFFGAGAVGGGGFKAEDPEDAELCRKVRFGHFREPGPNRFGGRRAEMRRKPPERLISTRKANIEGSFRAERFDRIYGHRAQGWNITCRDRGGDQAEGGRGIG